MRTRDAAIACLAALGTALASAHSFAQATFKTVPLVGDIAAIGAPLSDSNLVNPWGIASLPSGPFWIANQGTGTSTLYDGTGAKSPATFTVPGPANAAAGFLASPTGIIWNPSSGFAVPGSTSAALFIFCTLDGTIAAWAGGLSPNPQSARIAVDKSASGAAYTGLAFGTATSGNYIYAANFAAGTIDAFDTKYAPAKLPGKFVDPQLPPNYVPFNVANISGNLWVSYAVQKNSKQDQAGIGNGVIDVFSLDGVFIRRLVTGGDLNSPWAITPVPYGFTSANRYAGNVLIGNFGDGLIHVYSRAGQEVATLQSAVGTPLKIFDLWALQFGGASKSNPQTLYYTAGANQEKDGVFGIIAPVAP